MYYNRKAESHKEVLEVIKMFTKLIVVNSVIFVGMWAVHQTGS